MDLPDSADDSGMDHVVLDYVVEEIMDDVFKMVSEEEEEEEEEEFVMDVNEREEGQDAEEVKCAAEQSCQDHIVKQEEQDQREAGQQQEQEEQEKTEQEENQQTQEQHEAHPAQTEKKFLQVQKEQAQLKNQDPTTLCKDFEIRLERMTPTVLKNISSSCFADASKKRCLDSNCSKRSSSTRGSSSSNNSKGSTRGSSPFHKDSANEFAAKRPGKFFSASSSARGTASLKKRSQTEKSPSQTAKRRSPPPALAKATKRLSCPWCFR